tara:strand:- start:170 stop:343 length:174 start_codon:yes stop_codon:yes gene_type:complete
MDYYIYVIIITFGIFFCPFCFLTWEISIVPKLQKCFEKKPKNNENNENNLNENLIDN